jgi:hypothetical protein
MKSGKVFWAAFFIVVGVLGLLHNLSLITVCWSGVWRFWPVLLILLGAAALLRNPKARWVVMACVGACAGLVLFALVMGGAHSVRGFFGDDGRVTTTQTIRETDDSSFRRASLRLEAGAGTFTIEDTTSDLVYADIATSLGIYGVARSNVDSVENVLITMNDGNVHWKGGNVKNTMRLRVSPRPLWDFTFEIGAAKMDLDLRPYAVRTLTIEGGASSLHVKLGDRADSTRVSIEAGVSSIHLDVPDSVDCEIVSDAALSSRDFEGFERSGERWRSANYGASPKKMVIFIEAGMSSVEVRRVAKDW